MTSIEKRPGWDWAITYDFGAEGQSVMSVFGCVTIEEAIREARWSFAERDQSELVILKAERIELARSC